VENLKFLPAGSVPPSPSELLDSQQFADLIEKARNLFDIILIDSPPALLVTDPVVLSEKVDGVILVVRAGATSQRMLSRVSRLLGSTHSNKLGIVMNSVDTSSVEYYYSYGYYGTERYFETEGKEA
jgi:capsular exopolysaccharide synthesis family protein